MEVGVIAVLTGIGSFFDLKERKIPRFVFLISFILVVIDFIIHLLGGDFADIISNKLLGLVPGAFLFLLAFITNEKVGLGDGLFLMPMGLLGGAQIIIIIFCIGLFLQSLCAVGILVCKKGNKQTQIPFIPFLLAGCVLMILYKGL